MRCIQSENIRERLRGMKMTKAEQYDNWIELGCILGIVEEGGYCTVMGKNGFYGFCDMRGSCHCAREKQQSYDISKGSSHAWRCITCPPWWGRHPSIFHTRIVRLQIRQPVSSVVLINCVLAVPPNLANRSWAFGGQKAVGQALSLHRRLVDKS